MALAVDDSGSIYVADRLMEVVRKYSAAGEYIETIAVFGDGPGELLHPRGIVVLEDGRILIYEAARHAVYVYSPDGEYEATWLRTASQVFGSPTMRLLPDDRVAIKLPTLFPPDDGPVRWPRALAEVVSSQGTVVDTLWGDSRYATACGDPGRRRFQGGFQEDIRGYYLPRVTWSIAGNGSLLIGCPKAFAFDVIDADGSAVRVERTAWQPVSVSSEELESFRAVIAVESGHSRREVKWEAGDLTNQKPAYRALFSAGKDRVWVLKARPGVERSIPVEAGPGYPSSFWREPPGGVADVFTLAGEYLGPVAIPNDFAYDVQIPPSVPPVIRGDTVWAVTTDSLDLQYITRYRLVHH